MISIQGVEKIRSNQVLNQAALSIITILRFFLHVATTNVCNKSKRE